MKIRFTRLRSAGVPVVRHVHQLISVGNAARDRRDWPAAAAAYRAALSEDKGLRHIWIQLGHAEKEANNLDGAEEAYRRAGILGDADGEAALQLGHVAKLRGDGNEAARQYMRAMELNPGNADAMTEVHAMASQRAGMDRSTVMGALSARGASRTRGPSFRASAADAIEALIKRAAPRIDADSLAELASLKDVVAGVEARIDGAPKSGAPASSTGTALVFDASDLIAYFKNARLPTGIQRVQIETISSALRNPDGRVVKVCCFAEKGDEWLEVPSELFLELCELSVIDGDRTDPDWLEALNHLHLTLALADPLVFPQGAFLINLGTSWWLQNYFLFVRQAKAQYGIHYIPFVHDFIPVMAPEHCIKELTQDFISWATGVFQHADFFLVNSAATRRDLLKVAGILGQTVDSSNVSVIPLDADFRRPDRRTLPDSVLSQWRLKPEKYVLFVSTIESRKNHALAFDAWLDLAARHGSKRVPKLVCVGNRGWLNDAVYARLDQHPVLRDRVVMLSHLSDEELGLLYRRCLFTLYPSLYEGWGLPVTESLCYGKVALASDSSSLPEAGGPFADYFPSGSLPGLVEKLERLMFDQDYRRSREAHIFNAFAPRTWQDIARQIETEVRSFVDRRPVTPSRAPPAAIMGRFHPIQRNFETRIWPGFASGEIYRSDSGWWWPDKWGCWTKPQGGELRIGVPAGRGELRAYFLLHAPAGDECTFTLEVEEAEVCASGVLAAEESRWVALDIPVATPSDILTVRLSGSNSVDLSLRSGGIDTRAISIGLAGFFLCEASDLMARTSIMEAIVLKDQDSLSFNREDQAKQCSVSEVVVEDLNATACAA